MTGAGALTARRLLACAASVVFSAGVLRSLFYNPVHWPGNSGVALIAAGLPLVAAAAIWSRLVIAQVLSRGVWWCFLVMGAFMASSSVTCESYDGTFTASCAAVALLAAGRAGLERGADDRFQPVAFRGTLLLSLVMAIADAVVLTAAGGIALIDGVHAGVLHRAGVLLPLGLLMAVGVVGLVRLRTWGLLVALAANALVAGLAVTDTLPVSHLLQKLFSFTALLQLVVPLPMLVTLVRRRAPGPDHWQRVRWTAATMAIVVLVGFSFYATFINRAAFTPHWQ